MMPWHVSARKLIGDDAPKGKGLATEPARGSRSEMKRGCIKGVGIAIIYRQSE